MRTVGSLTREYVRYDIDESEEAASCSCPAFTMGKRRGMPCKHIAIYELAFRMCRRCREKNHYVFHGDAMCAQCVIDLLVTVARKQTKTIKAISKTKKKPAKPLPSQRR